MSRASQHAIRPPPQPPDHHPYNSIADQLQVEIESLQLMQTLAFPTALVTWQPRLGEALRQAKNTSNIAQLFHFVAPLPRNEQNEHCVHLGIDINRTKAKITYCLVIGHRPNGKPTILRKVHFDIETVPETEPKPIGHFQFDGGWPKGLEQFGYDQVAYEQSVTQVEKPRIPCLPPTFALLAHWAFLEYQSTIPDLKKFIHSPAWISCIRKTERAVLAKYFEHGHDATTTERAPVQSYLTGCYRPR